MPEHNEDSHFIECIQCGVKDYYNWWSTCNLCYYKNENLNNEASEYKDD